MLVKHFKEVAFAWEKFAEKHGIPLSCYSYMTIL
jgi:hypothetical protein